MGDDDPWLRRRWLHRVSPEVKASIDGRLIHDQLINWVENKGAALGRSFVWTGKVLAIAKSRTPISSLGCAGAEQVMTDQYYSETAIIECRNDPGPVRAFTPKCEARNEARKQREIEIKRRTATQLRTIIAGLERAVANLDVSGHLEQ
jgi:hypothetical protein